jgi:hypothetical protein
LADGQRGSSLLIGKRQRQGKITPTIANGNHAGIVKYDSVAKSAVADPEEDDGQALRSGVPLEFQEQNSADITNCTAMKVALSSKRQ